MTKIKDSKLVLKNKIPNYDGLKPYSFTYELKHIPNNDFNRFVQYYYDEILNVFNYLENNDMTFYDFCILCYKNSSEGNTKNYPKRIVNSHLYQNFYHVSTDNI
jgi:hypothetical protein